MMRIASRIGRIRGFKEGSGGSGNNHHCFAAILTNLRRFDAVKSAVPNGEAKVIIGRAMSLPGSQRYSTNINFVDTKILRMASFRIKLSSSSKETPDNSYAQISMQISLYPSRELKLSVA
jgi:hypothetical protein